MNERNVSRESQLSLRGISQRNSFEAISTARIIEIASVDAGKRELAKTKNERLLKEHRKLVSG